MKCFSRATAPSVTATTGATIGSREWSESPTWQPVASRSVTIARAFTSAGGVGYAAVHWRSTIRSLPTARASSTTRSTSASTEAPVEMKVGFRRSSTFRTSGRWLSS